MNPKLKHFAQRYTAALRVYLKPDACDDLLPARKVGRQAQDCGVAPLGLAHIHEQAIVSLQLPEDSRSTRVDAFFSEAIANSVQTASGAQASQLKLDQINHILGVRSQELALAQRELKRSATQRRQVEATLRKCDEHYTLLLKRSLRLQDGLRHLTHRLVGAQEKDRRKFSARLENGLVQTLVGVNVRLLNAKKTSRLHTDELGKQIASTQRAVVNSARSMRRAATRLTNT